MRLYQAFFIASILFFQVSKTNSLLAVNSRDRFIYPSNVNGERNLAKCPENVACNVVYRPFWVSPVIQRHCRCADQNECSSNVTGPSGNFTLMLDNRNEFKFCSSLNNLKKCLPDQLAIKVVDNIPGQRQNLNQPPKSSQKIYRFKYKQETVQAFCQCPERHFWKPVPNETNHYTCSKLAPCSENAICGYIRTDLFSTYYQCSCPIGQICLNPDKVVHNRNMFHYSGPVYTAVCKKNTE